MAAVHHGVKVDTIQASEAATETTDTVAHHEGRTLKATPAAANPPAASSAQLTTAARTSANSHDVWQPKPGGGPRVAAGSRWPHGSIRAG